MKYKSISIPAPSLGELGGRKKLVIPNQSLSLQEILERFTRKEALPIGRDANYHESDDDLEKVAHFDLVDKAEFSAKLSETQKTYKKQEAGRLLAARRATEAAAKAAAVAELAKNADNTA